MTRKAPTTSPEAAPDADEHGIVVLDRDHGDEAPKHELVSTAFNAEFVEAKPSVYAAEIRRLASEARFAGETFAVKTVLLGRYCRDAKHAMNMTGEEGFQSWLKTNVPDLAYNSVSVAMRTARMLSQQHPELRRLDSPEKISQLTGLIGGSTFKAFAQSLGAVAGSGNVDPNTGNRKHHASDKTGAERAEDAVTKRAANMVKAIDTLQLEVEHGNFDALTDAEAEVRMTQLESIVAKIRDTVIGPRRAAKERGRTGKKPATRSL